MDPAFAHVPLDDLLEGIKLGTHFPTALALPNDFILIQSEPLLAAIEFNQSVTYLDLSCNNLGDAIGQKLGNILKSDRILRTVLLRDNTITESGFCRFAEAIQENDTCTTLDLSCNFPGVAALVKFSEGLAKNRGLTSLNLAYVKLTEASAAHLCKALECEEVRLQHLDVSYNVFGEDGCRHLVKALAVNRALLSLDISGNSLRCNGAAALAEALKLNRTLETLRARDNFIKAAGAAALGKGLQENRDLVELDLSKNAMWEGGAPELARGIGAHPALRRVVLQSGNLRLGQTASLGAALSAEGAAPSLVELDLGVNAIEEVGVEAICAILKAHKKLRSLSLKFNTLRDTGAAQLVSALAHNKTLQRLDLQHNGITESGAAQILEKLRANSTLEHLDIGRNQVGAATVQTITRFLNGGRDPVDELADPLADAMRLLHRDFGGGGVTGGGAEAVAA